MSNTHKLFIAIPLEPGNKEKLIKYQKDHLNNICFRYVSENDLHLTLVFLGENDDLAISEVTKSMDEISKRFDPINIKLEQIEYGPTPNHQRIEWIKGEREKTLQELKNELQEELYS
jgi:2'-5' RNA ligase